MWPIPPLLFPLLVFSFSLFTPSLLFAGPITSPKKELSFEVLQGELLYLSQKEGSEERYRFVLCFNRKIPFFKTGILGEVGAFIGIDLNQKAKKYQCEIEKEGAVGNTLTDTLFIKVLDGAFRTQELTVERSKVDLDPPTVKRVIKEKDKVGELWMNSGSQKLWNGDFILPVQGEARSTFGLRRIFNGQPRNPHTGEDFSASLGEAVLSSNSGVVKLVEDLFFSGKSIFIDHGLGMYSMYFHLSETLVEEGQEVQKGEIIGLVGSSGRATGPHLHWGVRINSARVNPLALMNLSSKKQSQ